MAEHSAIEWTDSSWNPTTGCSKVSPGCAHCYAETLSLRYGWSKLPWTPENATENVRLHPERLTLPLTWRKPRMIFVNSMSDLFHEEIPFSFIARVWATMADARRHVFQVLTKRPERAVEFVRRVEDAMMGDPFRVLPNVWLGVSIESSRFTWRADVLREIPAAVRFVSAEPLLGSLFDGRIPPYAARPGHNFRRALSLEGIDWLIAGGESGPPHRPLILEHVRELRDACLEAGVPFFFKQVGGPRPKSGGKLLDGREWCEMPRAMALA